MPATDAPTVREVESLAELLKLMRLRCSDKELDTIRRAYKTAEEAHKDQKRSSGVPYIQHPLAVAGILAEMKLDAPTIAAALMHDVAEDTVVTIKDIETSFTPEIAGLIDAVTKLSKREGIKKDFTTNGHANGNGTANGAATGSSNGARASEGKPNDPTQAPSTVSTYRTDREAESLRKMLLGLASDTRVVLIKLADRLHNMRTLDALKPEKQRRIARETLDIFAPLANRLGIWEWKQELEDLGFRYAEPQTYAYLQRILEVGALERDAQVKGCIAQLSREMRANGIQHFEITGRAKQLYSLWRKMQRKGTSLDLIRDAQAIRVILNDDEFIAQEEAAKPHAQSEEEEDDNMPLDQLVSRLNEEVALERGQKANAKKKDQLIRDQDRRNPAVQDCYRVLGLVHSMWKPIPGEFDDYISVPKDNQYRSLHTAVFTDDGTTLEVQIRSRSMHKAAEFGIAAHWLYKDQGDLSADYMKQIEVLRDAIKALGNDSDDATSFMDAMKAEHFKDNIYCFTPLGKLIELPKGATALDFAYHVHTEVGHKCRGAKIDGAMVPLTSKLTTGQQVEIITRNNATPSRDWIHDPEYLYTASAKSKVKAWFRKQERGSNINSGREIIERELRRLSVEGWLKVDDIFAFYKNETDDLDDFLEKVGYGHITTGSIGGRVLEEERRREQAKQTGNPLLNLIRPKLVPSKKGGWVVAGARGVLVAQASCCNPQPGDDVIGYVSITGGVKIHKRDCDNLRGMESDRMIDVAYEGPVETYPVQFEVTAAERTGLLAELTAILSHEHINILGCNIDNRDAASGVVYIYLNGELPKPDLVTGIISRLAKVKHVFEVKRVIGNANGRRR